MTILIMRKAIDTTRFIFYIWLGIAYSVLSLLTGLGSAGTFNQKLANNLWLSVYVIIFNFILFEKVIPFIRKKKDHIVYNILLGFIFFLIFLIVYTIGIYGWRQIGIEIHFYVALTEFKSLEHAISNFFGYSVGSLFLFGIIRHVYNFIKLSQDSKQLLIEKKEAELNYLKSQTNPHFLFNTLNNIYSLARDKSDLAPESIMRLSKILRFMLYETSDQFITVEQELKVMTDYISLEQLRYDESLRVNLKHDVEDMRQAIPPLLLIPLVENAFKHGVSETIDQPFVDIYLSIKNRQLTFIVKNPAQLSQQQDVKKNIGLSNLKRQLELLYTDYNLTAQQDESNFTTTLKINLSTHV